MCHSDVAAFANMEYFSERTFQGGMSDLAELRQFFLTEEKIVPINQTGSSSNP